MLEAEFKFAFGTAAGMKDIATWRSQSITRFDQDSFRVAASDTYKLFLVEEHRRHFSFR